MYCLYKFRKILVLAKRHYKYCKIYSVSTPTSNELGFETIEYFFSDIFEIAICFYMTFCENNLSTCRIAYINAFELQELELFY